MGGGAMTTMIGIGMIVALFVGLFYCVSKDIGAREALIIFGIAIGVEAWIITAIWLISR